MARTLFIEGFELPLVDIGNEIDHDVIETKYPYQNGADIEDQGVNPESFRFTCLIIDENYEKYFEIRKFFLSRFDVPVMLTHPKLGILMGYPRNASFGEELKKGFVTLNFEFLIDDLQPSKTAYIDILSANEASLKAVVEETIIDIQDLLAAAGVHDVPGSDFSLLDKWAQMGDAARAFASACGATVAKLQGYIAAVQGPIDAISTSIDFIDSLAGNLTRSITECCESFLSLSRKIDFSGNKSASKAVIATLANDLLVASQDLNEAPQGIKNAFNTVAAAMIGYEAARLISSDESALTASMSSEAVQIDDDNGNMLSEPSEAYLVTPAELEDTLAVTRSFINDQIKNSASSNTLKKMASVLAQSILKIKLEFMTTKKIVVHESTPLHAILNSQGLSYKADDRVCALNDIVNPTFVEGEVLIYAK